MFKIAVTVGLAFTVRRKRLRPDCCWKRPGLLQWVLFHHYIFVSEIAYCFQLRLYLLMLPGMIWLRRESAVCCHATVSMGLHHVPWYRLNRTQSLYQWCCCFVQYSLFYLTFSQSIQTYNEVPSSHRSKAACCRSLPASDLIFVDYCARSINLVTYLLNLFTDSRTVLLIVFVLFFVMFWFQAAWTLDTSLSLKCLKPWHTLWNICLIYCLKNN